MKTGTKRARGESCRVMSGGGVFAVLALLSSACSDDGLEMQTVEGMRVLGARVESATDSGVAQPKGDVHLRWLVVSNRPTEFNSRLEVCLSVPVTTGLQECDGEPFFASSQGGDTESDLSFDFALPPFREETEWLAKLALCEKGEASFDAHGVAQCSERSEAIEALTTAWVTSAESNRNPELADDVLTLRGKPWLDSEAVVPGDDCSQSDGLPQLKTGNRATVGFELGGEDREPLPTEESESYGGSARESLLYAHFLTLPGLERALSNLQANNGEPGFELELLLDKKASLGDGKVAEFILVVRDDRGGTDWTRRKLCGRSR